MTLAVPIPSESLAALAPISLAELNDQAALMTRVDRKYFVPREVLNGLIEKSHREFRALEIEGIRLFEYRTVYFDTPDFRFFYQHAQGRRHRFKVRTRTYSESGDCRLEVKSKGYRGQTVKQRIPHDPNHSGTLGPEALAFIESITDEDATQLRPVLETVYHRATLCHDDQRVTCDIDLACRAGRDVHHGPQDVLVETKSSGSQGPLDRMLHEAGIRTHSVSKYCVAASLLYPHLTSNVWRRTMNRYFTGSSS